MDRGSVRAGGGGLRVARVAWLVGVARVAWVGAWALGSLLG
ncbi:fructose-1-phosphate kinase PfkB-like protein [Saccharothrix ecbatanensis]|uniref:Fructose-1-phosphate kinase PfkB-like protein n=1 Tax=Saccharothrix ecbatanensis TaxID=1105145 RepID=A0A7W9LZT1_9PSEU|nr:hypothetical protein [Saccharothrix ecbatanensis]MBB5802151.1 fructose-1-phosphate kinase PfkB-like protein [Saccharothrix ecbatanensis]